MSAPPAGIREAAWLSWPPEARAFILAQQQENDDLRSKLTALATELASLRERIGRSSRNSSKPPSSDGRGFKPPEHRKGSGRKRGGQPGHPGSWPEIDAPHHRPGLDRLPPAPGGRRCQRPVALAGAGHAELHGWSPLASPTSRPLSGSPALKTADRRQEGSARTSIDPSTSLHRLSRAEQLCSTRPAEVITCIAPGRVDAQAIAAFPERKSVRAPLNLTRSRCLAQSPPDLRPHHHP